MYKYMILIPIFALSIHLEAADVDANSERVREYLKVIYSANIENMKYIISESKNIYNNEETRSVNIDDKATINETMDLKGNRKSLAINFNNLCVLRIDTGNDGTIYCNPYPNYYPVTMMYKNGSIWPVKISVGMAVELNNKKVQPPLMVLILENNRYKALNKNEVISNFKKDYGM